MSSEVENSALFETRRNDRKGFAYAVESIIVPEVLRYP